VPGGGVKEGNYDCSEEDGREEFNLPWVEQIATGKECEEAGQEKTSDAATGGETFEAVWF